jgi:predicted metal-dependent RNase
MKVIQIEKEAVKLALFAYNMILYLKDPKIFTKKLDIINTFSRVSRHKIDIQKSAAFLYTNNEQLEKELQKTILFTTATKTPNYL